MNQATKLRACGVDAMSSGVCASKRQRVVCGPSCGVDAMSSGVCASKRQRQRVVYGPSHRDGSGTGRSLRWHHVHVSVCYAKSMVTRGDG
eukprot:5421123-Prymnesium_polylepis.1